MLDDVIDKGESGTSLVSIFLPAALDGSGSLALIISLKHEIAC